MEDLIVRLVPMPSGVEGFTLPDENGDYNVYISDRLDEEQRREAFLHELEHIADGHFYDDTKTVREKEEEVKK